VSPGAPFGGCLTCIKEKGINKDNKCQILFAIYWRSKREHKLVKKKKIKSGKMVRNGLTNVILAVLHVILAQVVFDLQSLLTDICLKVGEHEF
jgi:hypothetical protein